MLYFFGKCMVLTFESIQHIRLDSRYLEYLIQTGQWRIFHWRPWDTSWSRQPPTTKCMLQKFIRTKWTLARSYTRWSSNPTISKRIRSIPPFSTSFFRKTPISTFNFSSFLCKNNLFYISSWLTWTDFFKQLPKLKKWKYKKIINS